MLEAQGVRHRSEAARQGAVGREDIAGLYDVRGGGAIDLTNVRPLDVRLGQTIRRT